MIWFVLRFPLIPKPDREMFNDDSDGRRSLPCDTHVRESSRMIAIGPNVSVVFMGKYR